MTQPTTPQGGNDTSPLSTPADGARDGGAAGQNTREAGDTRRTDQNNQHKGGADPTGGPGGTGGSVL